MKHLLYSFLIFIPCLISAQEENQINIEGNTGQCGKIEIIDTIDLETLQSDNFGIEDVIIVNNCIKFNVNYGGGCGTADFKLITDNRITESMHPRIDVYLKLTDQDICKAIISRELSFNLNGFLNSVTENGLQIRIINNDSTVVLEK